jgi:hypothetical protein
MARPSSSSSSSRRGAVQATVNINGHEVAGNGQQLYYFPRDGLTHNVDLDKLRAFIDLDAAVCYVYFVPAAAYIQGARTFTQFDPTVGQYDALLLELFCALCYRKRHKVKSGLGASTLVTERAVGPQGETRGWFFFLYDITQQDDGKQGEANNQLISVSVPQYILRLNSSLPTKKFEHLRPSNPALAHTKDDPFIFWPKLVGLREDALCYIRAARFYLDDDSDPSAFKCGINAVFQNPAHLYNPARVFSLDNALLRYNRTYGQAWYHGQPVTAISVFKAQFPVTSGQPMPSIPTNATIMASNLLLPAVLGTLMRPEEQYSPDDTTPEMIAYTSQMVHVQRDSAATIARFSRVVGTALPTPAQVSMQHFFDTYQAKRDANVPRNTWVRGAYALWPSVWNPLMQEGGAYSAMLRWSSTALRSQGNFCQSVRISDPTLSVVGNICVQLFQSVDVLKGVASAHLMILLELLVMHGASYLPDSTKNLVSSLMKQGAASTSKTFCDLVCMSLCIPGTVTKLAHETELANLSNAARRGYVSVSDEMKLDTLGVKDGAVIQPPGPHYEFVRNPTSMSGNKEATFKNQSTSRDHVTRTATADGGKRITAEDRSITYGVYVANTNANEYDFTKSVASRWMFYTAAGDDVGQAKYDALDRMTAVHINSIKNECDKQLTSLAAWMHRTHFLSTRIHIFVHAGTLSLSLFLFPSFSPSHTHTHTQVSCHPWVKPSSTNDTTSCPSTCSAWVFRVLARNATSRRRCRLPRSSCTGKPLRVCLTWESGAQTLRDPSAKKICSC